MKPAEPVSHNGSAPGGHDVLRQERPNYHKIHYSPLPVAVYPLPTFQPHNPLTSLYILWKMCGQYLLDDGGTSPKPLYRGYLSSATRSVHVTDPVAIRALWEMGFFGKGSLSRSEPTWFERERRRKGLPGGEAIEDVTRRRRKDRKDFKLERARKEREIIEQQLKKESTPDAVAVAADSILPTARPNGKEEARMPKATTFHADHALEASEAPRPHAMNGEEGAYIKELSSNVEDVKQHDPSLEMVQNEEHLQLSPEEAFFLVYGLGILKVTNSQGDEPLSSHEIFNRFCRLSRFPSSERSTPSATDPFLPRYVVYHHFRSLGWVVRSGVKFSVDFLLYNRGPPFAHAEFAVIIIPSHSHPEPTGTRKGGGGQIDGKKRSSISWHWLHCVNRVQAHVLKTLMLVFVEVPTMAKGASLDLGEVLRQYRLKEYIVRRWTPNRNRD